MTQDQFFTAVKAGDQAELSSMLEATPALALGRDGQGVSASLVALYHRKKEAADLLLARKEAMQPLDIFEAAAFGRSDRIEALLAGQPELANAYSSDGFYPLGLAAFFGHEGAVAILLARGADPNLAARNAMKVRALHAAAAARSLPIVKRLIEAGGDVNARQEAGFTPLLDAAFTGQHELAQLLLDHGADLEAKDAQGRSPLSMARAAADQKMIDLLISRGASA